MVLKLYGKKIFLENEELPKNKKQELQLWYLCKFKCTNQVLPYIQNFCKKFTENPFKFDVDFLSKKTQQMKQGQFLHYQNL